MNEIIEWFGRKKEMQYIDVIILLWIFLFISSYIYFPFNNWILIIYLFGLGCMFIIKSLIKGESYWEVVAVAFILSILTLMLKLIGKIK